MDEFVKPTNADPTEDPTRVLEKLAPYTGAHHLVVKPASDVGYLWDCKLTGETISDPDKLEKVEIKGLHTYGGFYGFFRPDLWEVSLLFTHTAAYKNLGRIDKIYCTTEPWGDGEFSKVYDHKEDRHRAVTTYLIRYKQ